MLLCAGMRHPNWLPSGGSPPPSSTILLPHALFLTSDVMIMAFEAQLEENIQPFPDVSHFRANNPGFIGSVDLSMGGSDG